MRILFVCTGNTCRSPIAEALFREKVRGLKVDICSAGVAAQDGTPASREAQCVLEERGIHHFHRAKRVNSEMSAWSDIVLTMTGGHKRMLAEVFPAVSKKVFTLNEYVGYNNVPEIADPFGGGLTTYRQCTRQIEQTLDRLLEKLVDLYRNRN